MQLEDLLYSTSGEALDIATGPLDKLPLLDEYRKHRLASLEGVEALFVQHHLAPFTARINAMFQDGLEPSRSWFLDIPYSTNRTVRQQLYKNLDPCNWVPLYLNPFGPYSSSQRKRARKLLNFLADQSNRRRFLIVDDGAYVLRILASPDTPVKLRERFRNARLVEQTSRGHRFLESAAGHQIIRDLGIVAVSIARSATKILFEAPVIGKSISRALKTALTKPDIDLRRSLVIGYGSIGAASALTLANAFPRLKIDVVDSSDDGLEAARRRGFGVTHALPGSTKAGEQYDLVVGCTGTTSFRWENRHLLSKVAFLASTSSTAVELDRERLVELADKDRHDDFEVMNDRQDDRLNIHADLIFRYGHDRKFTILNAGFPINFDGAPEHIPTVLIQPTHCLLYAAAVQALSHHEPGLRLLEPSEDYWILKHAEKSLIKALNNPQNKM